MDKRNLVWFAAVDAGVGRLLQRSDVPPGRVHVEECAVLHRTSGGLEHGRPSALKGKGGNTYASGGHEVEEELDRFAREVAVWLEREMNERGIERLTLFSAPRFLGAFRKVGSAGLAQRLDEQRCDLTGMSTAALAEYPAIRQLRSPGSPARAPSVSRGMLHG